MTVRDNPIGDFATWMIEKELWPILRKGRHIEKMRLFVCPKSRIAEHHTIPTRFGQLRVQSGQYVPPGYSYLIEDNARGFAWVSKPQENV